MAEKVDSGETQLVVFTLEDEEFACNIMEVREVLKLVKVTPLPRSLDFVEGVINLRGDVIPVIELRKRFGLQETGRTDESRIIIVEAEGRMIGLTVDSVSEVIRIPDKNIQDSPEKIAGSQTDLILGVGKINSRLLIILDMNRILSSEEQIALDDLTAAGRQVAQSMQD